MYKFLDSESIKKIGIEKYRNSKEYLLLRKTIINRDGGVCQECGIRHHLQIHHKLYIHVSNNPRDIITLCARCHAKKHPNNCNKILAINCDFESTKEILVRMYK